MKIIETEVKSKVSAVTVYQGRAMITRHLEIELNAGSQRLILADLPGNLDQDSIQVKGVGEATLGDCVFETEYFVEDVDVKKQPLLDRQKLLLDSISELTVELEACEKEKTFVDRIASYVTTPATHDEGNGVKGTAPAGGGLNATTWTSMLDFYHEKNAGIDGKKLSAERKVREIEQELEKIDSELDSLGYENQHSRNIIKVNLSKETKSRLLLDLSYLLPGPSWRPVYDLRASSDKDVVVLEYNALVNQATGENWEDAELKLSTARVNISGALPVLDPWRLRYFAPHAMRMPMAVAGRAMSKSKKEAAEDDEELFGEMASMPSESAAIWDEAEPDLIAVNDAEIDNSGTSVVFTVAGGGNINGDNSDTRVSLMRKELPASFHYSSVPKLSEFAYLTAAIENSTEFPLLPGKVNIFFDGSFVSSSVFTLIMPGQETKVSLGVDEGVKVEYRFIKRYKKSEGLVNKRNSEQFEYQIRVTNNRNNPAEIKVYDQFPISEEKEITVKRLSPVIKESQKDITIDDELKIQWIFELPPGEVRELPFSFLVEYPVGSRLSGI